MDIKKGVTVYCLTFNHAKFVEETIRGFLNQEVDFPFHVIIHDDASTDGTQEVIKACTDGHPELFTLILQSENQYSKGVDIYRTHIEPMIQTEYVCICEGDDFWCDTQKLKHQYAYMEANPECSMCVHNTDRILADGTSLHHPFSALQTERNYGPDEVIPTGGGVLFHTSSFMYRYHYRQEMPSLYTDVSVGDYPLAVHMSTCGHIHYIGKIMSAYRTNTPGSWTQRVVADVNRHVKHLNEMIDMLKKADIATEGKYHIAFQSAIEKNMYDLYITKNQLLRILIDEKYRVYFKREPKTRKWKYVIRFFAGPLLNPCKKLAKKIGIR